MLEQLDGIQSDATAALKAISDPDALRAWYGVHLAKKSPLMTMLGDLGKLPKEQRAEIGKRANQAKRALEAAYAAKEDALRRAALERSLTAEAYDVTLPGRPVQAGRLHVTTVEMRRTVAIFAEMGFQVFRSREVESDWYNFQLLNFPPDHPAREMQDTFYTTNPEVLLRTHTSPGQIRAMEALRPDPIRVILPGMCYRYEQMTARSEIMFLQVEGLAVGHHITMTDLKGTMIDFARRMYGQERQVRFRGSYFPFTEPSVEVDMDCILCNGAGCRMCRNSGWLEISGAGMVHPTVLRNGGYDPDKWSGFAFGMGPQRATILKYGIDDIRHFWANDLRFLEQF
jgi:phenylalanyl-tRNA synthetase alpha chain